MSGTVDLRKVIDGTDRKWIEDCDQGIAKFVEILCDNGIETFESCEGGPGHAYPEPTVRFHGERSEGLRALSVVMMMSLPVTNLRRVWRIIEGEPVGPHWEMTFQAPRRIA